MKIEDKAREWSVHVVRCGYNCETGVGGWGLRKVGGQLRNLINDQEYNLFPVVKFVTLIIGGSQYSNQQNYNYFKTKN